MRLPTTGRVTVDAVTATPVAQTTTPVTPVSCVCPFTSVGRALGPNEVADVHVGGRAGDEDALRGRRVGVLGEVLLLHVEAAEPVVTLVVPDDHGLEVQQQPGNGGGRAVALHVVRGDREGAARAHAAAAGPPSTATAVPSPVTEATRAAVAMRHLLCTDLPFRLPRQGGDLGPGTITP